jgi:hypothetical protein
VSDTVHLFSLDERKTNLMCLLYIFIVAVGDALHVSGVFAHRQERPQHTAQNTYATGLVL